MLVCFQTVTQDRHSRMVETRNLTSQIQSSLGYLRAIGKDQKAQPRVDKGVDTSNAYIDMIAGRQGEAARHILRTSCLDPNRILTKCNRWGNGSYTRNSRHPHT